MDSSKSNGPLADLDRQRLPAKLTDFYRRDPDTSQSSETVATGVVEPSSDSDAYILYLPEPSSDPTCLTLFDEALIPVCAPGLGVAMTDRVLAQASIGRGVLIVPFGQPLKTGGVYSMYLQPSAAAHPGHARIMQWFARQSGESNQPTA